MRFNYIVIILVLVGCAFLGRMATRPQALPGLQADLTRCLDAFWGVQGSQVQVTGTPAQAEVSVSVPYPAGTTARQEDWMQEFIPFVARRHPEVKLGSVRVTPQAAKAESAADSLAPNSYGDVTQVETVQQEMQAQLDSQLGAGRALILLASQSSRPQANTLAPQEEAPAFGGGAPALTERAAPAVGGGAPVARKRAPVADRSNEALRIQRPAEPTPAVPTGVLVVQSQEIAAQAGKIVERSTSGLRVVIPP